MKVLVLGGCSFLGLHVCEYYIKRREVVSSDNLTKNELIRYLWYFVCDIMKARKEFGWEPIFK